MIIIDKFHQVTTPFILSVCLADFLFAIVLLPTQATRWQFDTFETLNLAFSDSCQGIGRLGLVPRTGSLAKCIQSSCSQFRFLDHMPHLFHWLPAHFHQNECQGRLGAELDVHHPQPSCRPFLWWLESHSEVISNLNIIARDLLQYGDHHHCYFG